MITPKAYNQSVKSFTAECEHFDSVCFLYSSLVFLLVIANFFFLFKKVLNCHLLGTVRFYPCCKTLSSRTPLGKMSCFWNFLLPGSTAFLSGLPASYCSPGSDPDSYSFLAYSLVLREHILKPFPNEELVRGNCPKLFMPEKIFILSSLLSHLLSGMNFWVESHFPQRMRRCCS